MSIDDLKARRGTGTAYDQLCNERAISDALGAMNKSLLAAISTFCSESAWAVPEWKAQPHIKALFEIYAKAGEGKEDGR